jgi:membrane associated rhomboid family serine protease
LIPLKNLDPRRSLPIITLFIIAANVAVFLYQITLPPQAAESFVRTWGLVPSKLQLALSGHHYTLVNALIPVFTCMFLHGGFLHILGNMWFLWIFGANLEDRVGAISYLLIYFVCGIVSGLTQAAFSWGSHIPSIGASGAISGVLGAYIVLFPASRILTLVPLFIIWFTARIPALVFIGLWFIVQFLSGVGSLGPRGAANTGGVAWWAHIGGFLFGVFLARLMRPRPRAIEYYD